jgi:hypothetical protein
VEFELLTFEKTPKAKLIELSLGHLGIRLSGNLSPKTPLYKGVGSIPGIFKIYVCVSLDYNFYHI